MITLTRYHYERGSQKLELELGSDVNLWRSRDYRAPAIIAKGKVCKITPSGGFTVELGNASVRFTSKGDEVGSRSSYGVFWKIAFPGDVEEIEERMIHQRRSLSLRNQKARTERALETLRVSEHDGSCDPWVKLAAVVEMQRLTTKLINAGE